MATERLTLATAPPAIADKDHAAGVWPDAALLGVATIWGVNIPLMKIGLERVDIYVFNAVRLVISASVLVGFAWRERRRNPAVKRDVRWHELLLFAAMISAIYQVLFLLGIAHTTSGNTALIVSTIPVWTALMARVFLGEVLTVRAWLGLVMALAGTVIVALQKGDVTAAAKQTLGNLIILGSALLWAGGTVYSRPLLKRISPLQLSASASVISLPVHLLLALGGYGEALPALSSWGLWAIIIYSGTLSSGLALPMWNYGVRQAGAAHAAIIQNLVPLVAIGAAWISRGEPVTGAQLFGGALILGGLAVMRLGR